MLGCLGGCPTVGVEVEPLHDAATVAGAVGVFAILKAFSLGATALTGVEAISNGVPAFRPPQSRNAASTLAVMAALAITMFLGISWLSTHIDGVIASEHRSVVAQIAIAVFGDGSAGFFVVQTFTALILILAANTAYQDFPRLASILARDRYMPSQFVNRGDRLVFSNGVIVLGFLSCLMIYAFDAELSTLINFYVVGVFTSFTLSQIRDDPPLAEGGSEGSIGDPRVASVHRHQHDRGGDDLRRPHRRDHLEDARRGVALDRDHGGAGAGVRVDPPSLRGVSRPIWPGSDPRPSA